MDERTKTETYIRKMNTFAIGSLPVHFSVAKLFTFRWQYTLLRYGICVPCSKRLPTVRDAFSEALRAQNRLLWYRRDIRYQKPPSMVRTSHVYRERPPDVPTEAEERGSGSEIGDFAKNGHLYSPATAAKQPQSAMDYLKLPPTPLNYRRLPRPTARLPQSRPDRYHAPANYAGRISKPPQ